METWVGPGIRDQKAAYLLLRLIAGMDFFGHGFARIFTEALLRGR
jgi:thiosulfate dehydrogenase [quinone] large subunit